MNGKLMKKIIIALAALTTLVALSGCAVSPVTGLVCPIGTHPGPWGHHCFAD